jgi:hypothetical protein
MASEGTTVSEEQIDRKFHIGDKVVVKEYPQYREGRILALAEKNPEFLYMNLALVRYTLWYRRDEWVSIDSLYTIIEDSR